MKLTLFFPLFRFIYCILTITKIEGMDPFGTWTFMLDEERFLGNYTEQIFVPPLIEAVQANDLSEVKKLLENGANPNTQDESSESALAIASRLNSTDIGIVAELLKHKASLDNRNGDLTTPLHAAVKSGYYYNAQKIELLLAYGADINAQDLWGKTPFMCACHDEKLECIELLLKKGASLNQQDIGGNTALSSAIIDGKIKVIHAILCNKYQIPSLYCGSDEILVLDMVKRRYESIHITEPVFFGPPADKRVYNDTDTTDDEMLRTAMIKANKRLSKMNHRYLIEKKDCQKIGKALIIFEGFYTSRSRIAKQGFAQLLPIEIAMKLASHFDYGSIFWSDV